MPFEKSVFVPLDADETFALITRPDRLRRWQAITARVDLRAGGEYRWTIIPGHVARGTITEVEPGRRVVFTWGWEGSTDLPPGASTVIITLEPAPGGTTVRLVHEGLSEEQAASHAMGWEHYFGRLGKAVADGDAGPDEWAAAPGPIDAITSSALTLAACQRVLYRIGEADYGRATPCAEFTVAELAGHLIGSISGVGRRAGAAFPPSADGSLESRVADAAQIALEAWDIRGLDGTVTIRGGEMPAAFALAILSLEFLVHAWDFARATGQRATVPEAAAAYVLDMANKIITPESRAGLFGDELAADIGAGALERLIAFTGRDTGS
ncbi:MAG TPA: TIGR03086 family metal-binding protein [Streptosporangiaceae bacterium]|nr:TIGR03086 family metal-binding protein [Streptosporangiaceae bacterium]